MEQAMRRKVKRAVIRVALGTVAVCVSAVLAFAIVSGSAAPASPGGVDQVALAKCMAQRPPINCEAVVPGLAACMAQQRPDCNQAAWNERRMNYGPLQPGTATMTRAEAIATALAYAKAPSSTPLVAREMTLGEYKKLAGEAPDPAISPSRLVWVVSVHAPIMPLFGMPGSQPHMMQGYTAVIDATSKQAIETCFGCETLKS